MRRLFLILLLSLALCGSVQADFLFKAGSFSTGTGAADSTVAVTGVGFQGKALMLFWNGRVDTTDAVGRSDHYRGIGFATSSTDRKYVTTWSDDNAATSVSDVYHGDDGVIKATTIGAADFTSWGADGFTLTISTQFTNSVRVGYCVWGGTDITNVTTFTYNVPTSAGNFDITTIGFQPDITLLAMSRVSSASGIPGTTTDSDMGFGAYDGTSQGVMSGSSDDNQSTASVTKHYSYTGECVALLSGTAAGTEDRGVCSAMLANGLRINYQDPHASLAHYVHGLAMKGGHWLVGNSATRTDTTPWSVTGLGAIPSGGIVFSTTAAFSTQDTPTAPDQWSIGAFSATDSRVTVSVLDENNLATTEVSTAIDFDEVYDNISTSSAIQGQMDVSSIDADGVTWVMDDADPGAAGFTYVLFGPTAPPQSVVPVLKYYYDHMRH